MAKAPTPGAGKQRAAEAHAKRVLTLTVSGETLEFCPDNIPFGERMAVRKMTSLNYDAFWGVANESIIDIDAFRVLWWLAKRANGNRGYPFASAVEDVETAFALNEFNVELTDVDAPEEATENPES